MTRLASKKQRTIHKRNTRIAADRQRLMAQPGAMAMAIDELLAKKYSVSVSTIYVACKTVSALPVQ